ncbi:MAG: hypothetical protein COT85_04595 [Chlamydiae bacterium CG10_big_fil_rev_8_21_14_0_10_42_34]|nr:MAG: hypothetical protein COT85_04595 [Chlamydiae bacterium CG10_big_fil_rev_8_21_14_0_10_42_34]
MEIFSKGHAREAYNLLKFVFVVIPIVAGLDKFFDLLVDWDQFILPMFSPYGSALMMLAGVAEIVVGVGVYFKPKIFANIAAIWLFWIILNLLSLGFYYDIALRDFGLALSAVALGRLAKVCA